MITIVLAGSLVACDDEPECQLVTSFQGGLDGQANWNLFGAGACGYAEISTATSSIQRLIIYYWRDTGDAPEAMFIELSTGVLSEGVQPASVTFITSYGVWSSIGSYDCTANMSSVEHEDWTQIDFVSYKGVITCPNPLVSATGDPVMLGDEGTMGIAGHVYDEPSELPSL